jgi:hypothetical protein
MTKTPQNTVIRVDRKNSLIFTEIRGNTLPEESKKFPYTIYCEFEHRRTEITLPFLSRQGDLLFHDE